MKFKFFSILILLAISYAGMAQLGNLLKKKNDKKTDDTNQVSPPADNINDTGGSGTLLPPEMLKDNKVAWENNFESNIDWFSLTPAGNLVVSSNKSLFGVEGATGKILWKNEQFGNIDKDNFSMIANSPYIAMVSGGLLNRQHTILNGLDGTVIADTRNMGYKMVGKRYAIPNQNGFVFSAYENNKSTLFFIDAVNAKEAWKMQDVFTKNNEVVNTKPFSVSPNEFFIATDKNIYKLNSTEGKAVFSIPFKTPADVLKTEARENDGIQESTKNDEKKGGLLNKIPGGLGKLADTKDAIEGMNMKGAANLASTQTSGKFFKIDNSERVYFFNNKSFVIIDENTGKIIGEPFEFDDNLASFIPDTNGFLFATDEKKSELYFLDALTGKNKWAQPVKLNGHINRISLNEGKIAISTAKESGKNYVNIIDANTGEEVSKKEMKVSGTITNVVMTKRGLIYTTNSETNIQDPLTGKDVMSKSLKYKTGGSVVRREGKYYVLNDAEVSEIDETTGDVKSFATLNFKDKEDPQFMELRSNGFLVSSAQNMVLLDWTGKEIYHQYYKAPGTSLAGKILAATTMAVSLAASAEHGYAAGASGFGTTSYNDEMAKADNWGNLGSSASSAFSKRFKMTSASKNNQIILTKLDDGSDNGFGLIRINKDSGSPEAKVVIGDKKPDYLFDEVENVVYYRDSRNKIIAYKL